MHMEETGCGEKKKITFDSKNESEGWQMIATAYRQPE